MKQVDWKYIVLFILAIPVVNQLGDYLGKSSAQHINEKVKVGTPQQDDAQKVRIVVSSQDAEGLTQENFDVNFLNTFEAYIVEGVKLKTKKIIASQGHANVQINLKSEATYVYSGPIKLIVIRIHGSDDSFSVLINGIVGNELRRIACVRDSKEKIPITYGICSDKIKDVFGTEIGA